MCCVCVEHLSAAQRVIATIIKDFTEAKQKEGGLLLCDFSLEFRIQWRLVRIRARRIIFIMDLFFLF